MHVHAVIDDSKYPFVDKAAVPVESAEPVGVPVSSCPNPPP